MPDLSASSGALDRGTHPAGVRHLELRANRDDRGCFTEIFRASWDTDVRPVQWNVVQSRAGTLRGVHVHPRHDDYLIVVAGRVSVGLRDLRPGSQTPDAAEVVDFDGRHPAALVIPHGVAHGFLFHTPATHVYAVSEYWDVNDELGCRYDDPDLGIAWGARPSRVSDRDLGLQSLRELVTELRACWSGD